MIDGTQLNSFDQLLDRIQVPKYVFRVVIVLDSRDKNWDQLWATVSLREGIHSDIVGEGITKTEKVVLGL